MSSLPSHVVVLIYLSVNKHDCLFKISSAFLHLHMLQLLHQNVFYRLSSAFLHLFLHCMFEDMELNTIAFIFNDQYLLHQVSFSCLILEDPLSAIWHFEINRFY